MEFWERGKGLVDEYMIHVEAACDVVRGAAGDGVDVVVVVIVRGFIASTVDKTHCGDK